MASDSLSSAVFFNELKFRCSFCLRRLHIRVTRVIGFVVTDWSKPYNGSLMFPTVVVRESCFPFRWGRLKYQIYQQCVISLQATVRGYLSRLRHNPKLFCLSYSISQDTTRVVLRSCKNRTSIREEAIIPIQSISRRYLVRNLLYMGRVSQKLSVPDNLSCVPTKMGAVLMKSHTSAPAMTRRRSKCKAILLRPPIPFATYARFGAYYEGTCVPVSRSVAQRNYKKQSCRNSMIDTKSFNLRTTFNSLHSPDTVAGEKWVSPQLILPVPSPPYARDQEMLAVPELSRTAYSTQLSQANRYVCNSGGIVARTCGQEAVKIQAIVRGFLERRDIFRSRDKLVESTTTNSCRLLFRTQLQSRVMQRASVLVQAFVRSIEKRKKYLKQLHLQELSSKVILRDIRVQHRVCVARTSHSFIIGIISAAVASRRKTTQVSFGFINTILEQQMNRLTTIHRVASSLASSIISERVAHLNSIRQFASIFTFSIIREDIQHLNMVHQVAFRCISSVFHRCLNNFTAIHQEASHVSKVALGHALLYRDRVRGTATNVVSGAIHNYVYKVLVKRDTQSLVASMMKSGVEAFVARAAARYFIRKAFFHGIRRAECHSFAVKLLQATISRALRFCCIKRCAYVIVNNVLVVACPVAVGIRVVIRRGAATVLQARQRGLMGRRIASTAAQERQDYLVLLAGRATLIQATVRGFLGRCKVRYRRCQIEVLRETSALCIQCYVRQYQARMKVVLLRDEIYELRDYAATTIQSMWRGYVGRLIASCMRELRRERRDSSTRLLQRVFRSYRVRLWLQRERAAKRVQRKAKLFLWRQRMHNLKSVPATKIQSLVRGYLVRAKLLLEKLQTCCVDHEGQCRAANFCPHCGEDLSKFCETSAFSQFPCVASMINAASCSLVPSSPCSTSAKVCEVAGVGSGSGTNSYDCRHDGPAGIVHIRAMYEAGVRNSKEAVLNGKRNGKRKRQSSLNSAAQDMSCRRRGPSYERRTSARGVAGELWKRKYWAEAGEKVSESNSGVRKSVSGENTCTSERVNRLAAERVLVAMEVRNALRWELETSRVAGGGPRIRRREGMVGDELSTLHIRTRRLTCAVEGSMCSFTSSVPRSKTECLDAGREGRVGVRLPVAFPHTGAEIREGGKLRAYAPEVKNNRGSKKQTVILPDRELGLESASLPHTLSKSIRGPAPSRKASVELPPIRTLTSAQQEVYAKGRGGWYWGDDIRNRENTMEY